MKLSDLSSVIDLYAVETFRSIDATTDNIFLEGMELDDSWLVLGNVTARNEFTAKAETITVSRNVLAMSNGTNRSV